MNIEQLLIRFYDGVSTPEEELQLKAFFLKEENVDDRWKADRQLFNALSDETIQMPEGATGRLDKAIEKMDESYVYSKPKQRLFPYWISSAAAVVLLCVGLFFATQQSAEPQMADTFDDPVEAAIAAEKALAFVSSQLNKGVSQVAEAGQEMEKVNRILNKHLK